MSSRSSSDELSQGQTLGRYEVLRKLATGGMAEIYLARVHGEAGFEKLVVVKRILPALAKDRGFVQMFLDEARLAATLRHANIGDVFDVGEEDGSYFFAMEYVAGHDVRMIRVESKRRHKPIPLSVSVAIVSATASALSYAHARQGPYGEGGLVHRDVSPSNILVGYEGAIKLVDFGIARAKTRGIGQKTQTGTLKGKIPYMSPEQLRGEALDGRADLFSLGIVLYELTTGARPFQGINDFQVMEHIVNGAVAPPTAVVDAYPPELEALVLRMLDRERDARFESAEALLEELDAVTASARLFGSTLAVGKYMRELFSDRVAGWDRGTANGGTPGEPDAGASQSMPRVVFARATTEEYPAGEPPEVLIQQATDFSVEETTAGYGRHLARLRVPTPRPSPAVPPPPFEDPPTFRGERSDLAAAFSASADTTNADAVLPFDPISARATELLAEVDTDAPPDESDVDRSARRIPALFDQSWAWYELGELDKAVIAIELALGEDPSGVASRKVIHRNRETIATVYEAFLGDPGQRPTLARPLAELVPLAHEPATAHLLTRIDGEQQLGELIDRCGLPRLEACRQLCRLVLRGALVFA